MEDVGLVRRARKLGHIVMVDGTLDTSPQRYRHKGILRASLANHLTLLRYLLGTDNRRLYRRYYA
jgi:hypothetical protein